MTNVPRCAWRRGVLGSGLVALAALTLAASCGGEPPGAALSAGAERGRSLYAELCQSCHGDAATGRGAVAGVPIQGPDGHTWHHADGQLVGLVLGRLEYEGRAMPSFAGTLSEPEVLAIVEYLKGNWTPRQREFQQEVSENWERPMDDHDRTAE